MRRFPLTLLCLGSFWLAAVADAQPESLDAPPPRGSPAAVISPEISGERRITFRVRAPRATEVSVRGEFSRRSIPMQRGEDGVWSVTTEPVAPEIYGYYFVVDGVRMIDLANPLVKTGSTGRTITSLLEVPSASPAFHDLQLVPHGDVHELLYRSTALGTTRRVFVYTPPGYHASKDTTYPTLYLLHGANADESTWTRLGRANLIVDNLMAAGQAKPLVVVMPFGYHRPPAAGRGTSGMTRNTEQFGRDLIEDLIPFVEASFRVRADREHRAIAGLSMGGGQALSLGLDHLDHFSRVAGFSAAIQGLDPTQRFAGLVADPSGTNARLALLWLGCGTEDSLFPPNQKFADTMKRHGITTVFHATPGAHTWIVARQYLHELVPKLFVE